METLVLGDGGLGRAIAAACRERGYEPRVVGRPAGESHDPAALSGVDLAFEATTGSAVLANVRALTEAGCRRIVIGTTGWDADRPSVADVLRDAGAAAVCAANFSLAAAVFGRVVGAAASMFDRLDGFDPYVVEWHRRSKRDRPSGTARELARTIATSSAAGDPDGIEIASIRAGVNPGTHLVGFDGPGEAVELRLVARDRVAYADGALAAAAWLRAEPRPAGLHDFSAVVDSLLDARTPAVAM